MQIPSLEPFRQRIDAAALKTPGVDVFCSSTAWLQAAHEAFHQEAALHLYGHDDAIAVLAHHDDPSGLRLAASPESVWGLACPLLGPSLEQDAVLPMLQAATTGPKAADVLILSGLPRDATWVRTLVRSLRRIGEVGPGPDTVRRAASLEGGLDAYLGRRSRKFRAALRRSSRIAQDEGIAFVRCCPTEHDVPALLETVYGVEARSWKGLGHQGTDEGPMRLFTTALIRATARDGTLLVILARRDTETLGYLYGSQCGDEFRGLQMSFDNRWRSTGLGNLMQLSMVDWLCQRSVRIYDLGTDMPYKAAWAEDTPTGITITLVARTRR